jgi:hypothetical protein
LQQSHKVAKKYRVVWLSVVLTIDPLPGWRQVRSRGGATLIRYDFGQDGYTMTEITNDTEVFDAMRFDVTSGDMVWTGRMGTRDAIRQEKLAIDPGSWKFCPHQWLDERGFVDRELSRKHPHSWPPTL